MVKSNAISISQQTSKMKRYNFFHRWIFSLNIQYIQSVSGLGCLDSSLMLSVEISKGR